MAFTAIRSATGEGVTTITLARPERLNAFTSVMHAELRAALDAAEHDAAVRGGAHRQGAPSRRVRT
jgi:2-(1,2-epoxy-1,2-dihydrophenyl)acetyl-CoA isomerase